MAVDIIVDPWSPLTHKDWDRVGTFPNYLDDETIRRLTAYVILSAYMENVARDVLPLTSQVAPSELQEFGDAAVLVERVAAGVLGNDPMPIVVGADDDVPEIADIGTEPKPPETEGLDPRVAGILQRRYDIAVNNWAANAEEILGDWEEQTIKAPKLRARQRWLDNWAKDERLIGRLQENEIENIVAKGDGVVVCGWDAAKKRPTVEVFTPDTYVPELNNFQPTEFPDRVHLVWGYKGETESGDEENYVRRITYELVPIEEAEGEFESARYIGPDDTQTHVCLKTDATWLEADFDDVYEPTKAPAFFAEEVDPEAAEGSDKGVKIDRIPTGYDFIPVVHFPNTLSTQHHFGRSLIARLSQLIDEIQASATDASMSSRWAAQPPIVIKGLTAGETVDLTAGMGISGDNVDTVDLSAGLLAIMQRESELQTLLSQNAQVPDGLRGRVDAKDVPSGLALTLSFTPFVQLIGRLREARSAKYPLLLKFVQRIAIQNFDESGIDSEEVEEAVIQYGAFMPQDLSSTSDVIARLFNAGIISLQTALTEMQAAGLTIDDLQNEVSAIRSVDGEGALAIFEATGSSQAVSDYLGKSYTPDERGDGVDVDDGNVTAPVGAALPAATNEEDLQLV